MNILGVKCLKYNSYALHGLMNILSNFVTKSGKEGMTFCDG